MDLTRRTRIWLYAFLASCATVTPVDAQTNLLAMDLDRPAIEAVQVSPPSRSEPAAPCCHDAGTGDDFALGAAIGQAMGFTIVQHLVRLREERTRSELHGPFFDDWFTSVSHTGLDWDDGGKIFTNYIAHPSGGAVYAHIYRQNDRQRSQLTVGQRGYGGMVVRALAFSAAVSSQFELGPLSEASIGNVGLKDPRKMAWVDLVITPTVGTAWMVAEDLIDHRLLVRMDRKNEILRNILRSVLNPSRTGANLSRRKFPWYRERDSAR